VAGFLPETTVLADVEAELTRIYAERRRVIAAFVFNLAAWTTSGISAWFLLELMGSDIALWKVLALEGVIFALRSMAFVVPGRSACRRLPTCLSGRCSALLPKPRLHSRSPSARVMF
jgi:hypothetical protein